MYAHLILPFRAGLRRIIQALTMSENQRACSGRRRRRRKLYTANRPGL